MYKSSLSPLISPLIRIKSLLIIIFFILNGCVENKSKGVNNQNGYTCIVRVELTWKDNLSRYQRDNLIRQFGDDALFKSNGKDLIGFALNNNDELMHIDYTNDIKCTQKYKETQRILDTYLKPLKNSPKYKIIKKILKKNEFDNLEVKISYSKPKSWEEILKERALCKDMKVLHSYDGDVTQYECLKR
jgi:hypothetical protein